MSPITEQFTALQQEVRDLRSIIDFFVRATDYRFTRPIRGDAGGLRINTMATEKLGIFGVSPIAQWSSGTGRQDLQTNTGAAVGLNCLFSGNTGSTYYGIGDSIAALKAYGLLAL